MKLDAPLMAIAALFICAGVFVVSIAAGLIACGVLLAALVVLYREVDS